MKNFFILLVALLLLKANSLAAQQHAHAVKKTTQEGKEKSQQSAVSKADSVVSAKAKASTTELQKDGKQVVTSAKSQTKSLVPDSAKRSQVKKTTEANSKKVLEDKTSNLQYDSEKPNDAPWNKEQLSTEDLSKIVTPAKPEVDLSTGEKLVGKQEGKIEAASSSVESVKNVAEGKDLAKEVKSLSAKQDKNSAYAKVLTRMDSVSTLQKQIEAGNLKETLTGTKKVYSDKYKRNMRDSLGLQKADSIFKVANAFAKTPTPEEDLLKKINSPLPPPAMDSKSMRGMAKDSLQQGTSDWKTMAEQAKNNDLSNFKLPDSLLSELKPLSGRTIDSKYVEDIDSVRDAALKVKKLSMDEEKLTDEIKRTAFKDKPRFTDKIYFEGILGFVNDSTVTIAQISPSLAYRFAKFFSVGAGPTLSVQVQEKKVNLTGSVRSFVKGEIFKQRAYLQVEDNFAPRTAINREILSNSKHAVLAGGGGLLPLSKKIALNLAVLYRINGEDTRQTPWVFRIGISSIKNRGQ